MERADSDIIVPPRLLAGMAVMFWGAMVGMATVALVIALLLEGKSWLKIRWKITPEGHVRSFHLSLLIMAAMLAWVWLEGDQVRNLFTFVSLLPIVVLPIELAQRYGGKDSMYLNTFLYFSRQRMKRDIKEGRELDPRSINTGYPFIFLTLLAASCSESVSVWAMVGFVTIVLISVLSISRKRGMSWGRLAVAVPVLVASGLVVQAGMVAGYKAFFTKLKNQHNSNSGKGMNVNFSRLGGLGDIKQSKEIHWRMQADNAPKYLAISIYNSNHGTTWSYNYEADGFSDSDDAFLSGVPIKRGNQYSFEDPSIEQKEIEVGKKVTIRGGAASTKGGAVVPVFNGYYAVSDLNDKKTMPHRNPMGSMLLDERQAVIEYTLIEGVGFKREKESPNLSLDTELPADVLEMTKQLSDEIQLSDIPTTRGKIAAIREFFNTNFTYSTHFDTEAKYRREYLRTFMLEERTGHCEYFATAAALLLREQGIPARYCVGYVVSEQDGEEWLIRGTHAHAWCRVWIDGKWEDVDLTPPGWLTADLGDEGIDFWQKMQDQFTIWKEDFFLWRNEEANKKMMLLWLSIGGVLILAWIVYRLWQKKGWRANSTKAKSKAYSDSTITPLNEIEGKLEKVIGVRSVGTPFATWMGEWFNTLPSDKAEKWREVLELHLNHKYGANDETPKRLKSLVHDLSISS